MSRIWRKSMGWARGRSFNRPGAAEVRARTSGCAWKMPDLDGNELDENNLDDGKVVKLDHDGPKVILVWSQRVARLQTLDLTILS